VEIHREIGSFSFQNLLIFFLSVSGRFHPNALKENPASFFKKKKKLLLKTHPKKFTSVGPFFPLLEKEARFSKGLLFWNFLSQEGL